MEQDPQTAAINYFVPEIGKQQVDVDDVLNELGLHAGFENADEGEGDGGVAMEDYYAERGTLRGVRTEPPRDRNLKQIAEEVRTTVGGSFQAQDLCLSEITDLPQRAQFADASADIAIRELGTLPGDHAQAIKLKVRTCMISGWSEFGSD